MADDFICEPPGEESLEWLERDSEVASPSYTRHYDFVFDHGEGTRLWDVDGKEYLDFAAGIAVNTLGHSHPDVIEAVTEQLKKGIHAGFTDFYAKLPVEFCEHLLTHLPSPLSEGKIFVSNSGTEAVEAAYKIVKWHTDCDYVLSFEGAFHGRTMGSLSLTNTGKEVQRKGFGPFLPVKHSPFHNPYRPPCGEDTDCVNGCLEELDGKLEEYDIGGVFIEPIQGEGGYVVPDGEFIRGVRELCDKHDTLLISDEVQAGVYRTGEFLGLESFGVEPDVVALAKGIGGGVPLGATVAREDLMQWPSGSHATTFGGNLLACAAGMATLETMREEELGKNAREVGSHIMERLEEMKEEHELIGDVRGEGLMIGMELVEDRETKEHAKDERRAILCDAAGKGLVLLPAGPSAIRICPPLILTEEEADEGLDILESCFRDLEEGDNKWQERGKRTDPA